MGIFESFGTADCLTMGKNVGAVIVNALNSYSPVSVYIQQVYDAT